MNKQPSHQAHNKTSTNDKRVKIAQLQANESNVVHKSYIYLCALINWSFWALFLKRKYADFWLPSKKREWCQTRKVSSIHSWPLSLSFEFSENCKSSIPPKDPTKPLHVLSFVLRDSAVDFVNVSCWGSAQFIDDLTSRLQILNSTSCLTLFVSRWFFVWMFWFKNKVKIKNPLVKVKTVGDQSSSADEHFRPWTSSEFKLIVNENQSSIELLDENDPAKNEFDNFKNVPIRDSNDYYMLDDLVTVGKSLANREVNLLFAIREVALFPIRIIQIPKSISLFI